MRHSLQLRSSCVLHCSDVLLPLSLLGFRSNAKHLRSLTAHIIMMPRRRPKISRLDASHVRLAASLFPTGTNVPVPSPPSIGTPTSSNGSPTHSLISACARSSLLFSSPAPSSTPPATEPIESHSHPSVSGPSASVETNSTRPPSKRRRAKRSEEERIQYLRSDPYVAQFEAYRVLCASCDKWIRLRPNSTYCSIPWDAHRKSCLARKGCVTLHPFVIILTQRSAVPRSRLTTAPKMQRHHLL